MHVPRMHGLSSSAVGALHGTLAAAAASKPRGGGATHIRQEGLGGEHGVRQAEEAQHHQRGHERQRE